MILNMASRLYSICLFGAFHLCAMAQSGAGTLLKQLQAGAGNASKIQALKNLAAFYAERQPDSAVHYYTQAIKLADQEGDRKSQAQLLLQLGILNEEHGNREVAYRLVTQSLTLLRNFGDREELAKAYAELGLLEGEKKMERQASDDLARGLRLFREMHDTAGIVTIFSDYGAIFENRRDTARALEFYLKAAAQFPAHGIVDRRYLSMLAHIGELYIRKGNSKEALKYLEEGIRRADFLNLADSETQLLDQEGKAYEKLGNRKKALAFYKRELEKAKLNQLPFEQAKALVSIAGILKNVNSKASLAELQTALHIAADLKDKQLAASIYQAMSATYQQEKNYKEALYALDEHHRLLDSLFGLDKARELAGLDSSYELIESREELKQLKAADAAKKKEIDIGLLILTCIVLLTALLYFYFRKFRKLNRQLVASNQVKDKLFSVLGHDLRGPMGSAVQVMELVRSGELSETEQQELLDMLQKQSVATLATLEALLRWGEVQVKGVRVNPAVFDIRPAVDKAVMLLQQQAANKTVTLSNNTHVNAAIFADPDHTDFVIRNLLSNAIKFSKKGGRITIETEVQDHQVIVAVRDEGVGIDPEKLRQFHRAGMETSFGTGGEKGTGLGLLLVKEFVEAAGGKLWVESVVGVGTVFYFSLPRSKTR